MHPAYKLLSQPEALVDHLARVLNANGLRKPFMVAEPIDANSDSAVIVLVGRAPAESLNAGEPCLILNKRSEKVRQPGDLCCPGGSLMPRTDRLLSHLIQVPFLPLGRWEPWSHWKRSHPEAASTLSLLLATGLRECMEEMRLNPFGIRFLGPLPPHQLQLFKRKIYPLVGWVSGCQRFRTNWEVDKIVYLPLRELLDVKNFYRYRLQMGDLSPGKPGDNMRELPSFRHHTETDDETLWGATFHIAMRFLRLAFDFAPPELADLPIINGRLESNYLTGNNGAPGSD
jgi:hypothetical protein